MELTFQFMLAIIYILYRVYRLFFLKIKGLENIPERNKNLLFVSNHITHLDPILIGCTVFPKKLYFFAVKGLVKDLRKPFLYFAQRAGAIFIDRDKPEPSLMRKLIEILKKGNLLIFIEGKMVKPGEKVTPKPGAIYLASKTGAKILPVKIEKNGIRYRLTFGKEITIPSKTDAKMRKILAEEVYRKIMEL